MAEANPGRTYPVDINDFTNKLNLAKEKKQEVFKYPCRRSNMEVHIRPIARGFFTKCMSLDLVSSDTTDTNIHCVSVHIYNHTTSIYDKLKEFKRDHSMTLRNNKTIAGFPNLIDRSELAVDGNYVKNDNIMLEIRIS